MNSLVRLLETPVIHTRQLWRRFSLLLVCLLAVCIAPWPKAHAQEVFDSGHVDAFFVSAPDGQLSLSMKEDITGAAVERPGNDVILKVNENAWSDVTESIDGIGESTYYLPQTQRQDILWPGWDTQPAQKAGYTDVDLKFREVSGPGSVYVFETAGFGELNAVTNSGSLELTSGDVINQPYPAHRHVNWAFSQPGIYTMTVQAASNGDTSNTVTYTWDVGDGQAASSDEEASEDGDYSGSEESSDSAASGVSRSGGSSAAGLAGAGSGAAAGSRNGSSRGSSNGTTGDGRKAKAEQKKSRNKHHSKKAAAHAGEGDPDTDVELQSVAGAYGEPRSYLPCGIAILGGGMLVLGLGVARLALAKARD
ncbi:TPA: choice-of-anchor M domain-containing protein [Corynebacterium striatum]|nr:choice-of-anchor M domain-containing protein [Corynebacterium striatum]